MGILIVAVIILFFAVASLAVYVHDKAKEIKARHEFLDEMVSDVRSKDFSLDSRIKKATEEASHMKLEERLALISAAIELKGRDGAWNYSEYDWGFYNGMVQVRSMLSNKAYYYNDGLRRKPSVFLKDIQTPETK